MNQRAGDVLREPGKENTHRHLRPVCYQNGGVFGRGRKENGQTSSGSVCHQGGTVLREGEKENMRVGERCRMGAGMLAFS